MVVDGVARLERLEGVNGIDGNGNGNGNEVELLELLEELLELLEGEEEGVVKVEERGRGKEREAGEEGEEEDCDNGAVLVVLVLVLLALFAGLAMLVVIGNDIFVVLEICAAIFACPNLQPCFSGHASQFGLPLSHKLSPKPIALVCAANNCKTSFSLIVLVLIFAVSSLKQSLMPR